MTHHIHEMINTHPKGVQENVDVLVSCIQACFDCEQTCTSCADACLAEDNVSNLRLCIRLNLDCADICGTTGRVLSRQTETDWALVRSMLEVCERACRKCGDECERHGKMHEHCRVCAEFCERCEKECRRLLNALSTAS